MLAASKFLVNKKVKKTGPNLSLLLLSDELKDAGIEFEKEAAPRLRPAIKTLACLRTIVIDRAAQRQPIQETTEPSLSSK
jgi:hypothetical protein